VSHIPSKLLKIWSALTQWLLSFVLLIWLLLGLTWGALHWWIVPRIGEFRPQLEVQASNALGIPVRVGGIYARSNGMMPSFEMSDVTLLDEQGRVALRLPRVLVALSPRSFWQLGFEQIYIDAPKLDVRRLVDGRITVAGLEMAADTSDHSAAMDWFFSQIEFVIQNGSVRWVDEQRGAQPLELKQVHVVVRNSGRQHNLQLDAMPPKEWGSRFTLRGQFLQPLLSRQAGVWQDWEGQLFTAFDQVNLQELHRYVDLGVDVRQGLGALRAWVDVKRGQVTGATADVALNQVDMTLAADLLPLQLQLVQGRLGGRVLKGGIEVFGNALSFDTNDGLHWPGGNVRFAYTTGEGNNLPRGEVQADTLDLAALSQVVERLPVPAVFRDQLLAFAPKGQAEKLALNWQGNLSDLRSYSAKGRLNQLEIAAVQQFPGVRGLSLDFELDQQAGRADIRLENGSVAAPGIFQESTIDLAKFATQARWQRKGEHIAVQLSDVNFSNADAQGKAQIRWETSDPAKSPNHSLLPGVIDIQASFSRVDGPRIYRYLPLTIDRHARDYVRDAITAGQASNVRFDIRGEISQLPMVDPRHGAFKISADVRNATMAYVPRSLQLEQELPWPVLSGLSGKLLFDQLQLQVKDARCHVAQFPAVQVMQTDVTIPDLSKTEVKVSTAIKGPLKDALGMVRDSPIGGLVGDALAQTTASGSVDIKLDLDLPIAQLKRSRVQGSVNFSGNDLQITPNSPRMTRTRGQLGFSQVGLSLSGVQARMLGGDVLLEGGLVLVPGSARAAGSVIRATGTATADGLRQASELGLVTRLARFVGGSTAYTASLGVRDGQLEWLVQSNLQGMASNLPAPLEKLAETPLALRIQSQLVKPSVVTAVSSSQERISLTLGSLGGAVYERELSDRKQRVVRGAIEFGSTVSQPLQLPSQGISAKVQLKKIDLDAWQEVLFSGSSDHEAMLYLPTTLTLSAQTIIFGGYETHQLVLNGGREDTLLHANLDAKELNGYVEYRLGTDGSVAANAGRLYARLARLNITPSAAPELEALLDAQPASIPALDIVVEDFEVRGKSLGKMEVQAFNRMAAGSGGIPEWRLNKFNFSGPEATFKSTGNWTRVMTREGENTMAALPERRRTALNFKLDVTDSGALLARLGMKDLVRQGSGKLEGQASWLGAPLKINYPSLSGAFTVNVASGQFLKADPGIAKLLGVLSLQALPRRLTLDFRDVFSEGFAFDFLRGDVQVEQGIAHTNNLQMKGVNAAVLLEGHADIAQETQDLKVVVVPEINTGTASLIATVINPAVGLGSFLAQMFLQRPLVESNTKEFHVTGTWSDPQVTQVAKSSSVSKEKKP
jgi:uncharacterized protein (TIGR02099 family)